MKRYDFLRICRGAASACALFLAGTATAAAASIPASIELVADDEPLAIVDPYCPTCYDDPPSELVAESDTEATLVLACDRAVGEPLDGTLLVEVELDTGQTVQIHREPKFVLCGEDIDTEYETTLHAGPDWTWDSVARATVTVVQD